MKMKNVLMILITLAVVFAMAGAVSAEIGFKNQESSMKVNYSVKDNYVVEIPADVTFGDNNLVSNDNYVNATDVRIEHDHYLIVNLTAGNPLSENGLYSLVNNGSYIPYYINVTGSSNNAETLQVTNTSTFLKVKSGHQYPGKDTIKGYRGIGDYVKLTFETTADFIANATKSGNHDDNLTFTLKVVEE